MNNLYAANKEDDNHIIDINKRPVPTVKSHTVYLASLSLADPDVAPVYKLVDTIQHDGQKLYILSHNNLFYLSDSFDALEGVAEIRMSSSSLARVKGYGETLIKQLA